MNTSSFHEFDTTVEIPRALHGKRFDSALTLLLQERFTLPKTFSRNQVAERIKKGQFLLNGKETSPKTVVSSHDQVTFSSHILAEESHISSKEIPALSVLFENQDFLVVEKAAGIEVHPSHSRHQKTVTAWLEHYFPEIKNVGEDPTRPGIVHRLDRDTSGLLVIAKRQESFDELKKAFQERTVEKTYITLVYGHLPHHEGTIDASIMRRSGEIKRRAVDPKHSSETLPGNLRTAVTSYRVLARYEEYDLVEVKPLTGRTHQIRVHMAFLGHPVVGDQLYAFRDVKRRKLLFPSRQLLHAASLSFPLLGEKYQFSSPLPEDFRQALSGVDETRISSYDDEALKSLF
jgi:23S rRNA pseudouridine1911/1915/1917 synthase